MKIMKIQLSLISGVASLAALNLFIASPAVAVDLLGRYPTRMTAGDATPDRAREWQFSDQDIFRISKFSFEVGKGLRVDVGPADLGIGHCEDGAVWAVLLPRENAALHSTAASADEPIINLWLRFHPAELNRIFPPETVFEDGAKSKAGEIRAVVDAKFRSSWHAGQRAMIPEPKDVTVDADTKGGPRRFFVVDLQAQSAEYVDAFAGQAVRPGRDAGTTGISLAAAPPVVVHTVPEAGATGVDPSLSEIRVTFSKAMQDGSWSWSTWGEENFPDLADKPRYLADSRTCVLPVKLKPGKFYATWLNSNKFKNFKGADGQPAVPYLLTFQTAGASEEGK
jgi:hypothetical protein